MFGKHPRNILAILTLDIFIMLAVTVMMEYLNLAERFTMLENTVQIATDMALDTATASEEFFSESYQQYMTSTALAKHNVGKVNLGASTILYRDNKWFNTNTYILSKFYEDKHRLPLTKDEYESYVSTERLREANSTAKIFKWLFGGTGHSYDDGNLSWANRSGSTGTALSSVGMSGGRSATPEFKEFYDEIGHEIEQTGVVKYKTSSDTFTVVTDYTYPVLANMGLKLAPVNEVTSEYMTDNFCMSYHVGKKQNGRYSVYFLTPYSLGVTYVPVKVFKPVFMANLDTMARLQKLAGGDVRDMSAVQLKDTLNSADECLPIDVFVNGQTQQEHIKDSSQTIVTDGLIEYDLSSTKVRVDYFIANFYNEAYRNTVAKIEGAMPAYNNSGSLHSWYFSQDDLLKKTVNKLKSSDTTRRVSSGMSARVGDGKRIVAKVTVKLKVYIPYQSSIIQWFAYKDYLASGRQNANHYSVRTIDPTQGGSIIDTEDGTWYQYSTYIAITR